MEKKELQVILKDYKRKGYKVKTTGNKTILLAELEKAKEWEFEHIKSIRYMNTQIKKREEAKKNTIT